MAIQQHIAAKTDLNKPNAAGLTPLHIAAAKGDLATFKLLLQAGADPKRKSPDGKTPLDLARARNQVAIVQFLDQNKGKGGRGLIDGGLGVSEAMDNSL
jgi:ankyrin repeat protein